MYQALAPGIPPNHSYLRHPFIREWHRRIGLLTPRLGRWGNLPIDPRCGWRMQGGIPSGDQIRHGHDVSLLVNLFTQENSKCGYHFTCHAACQWTAVPCISRELDI
ncbi:hypothetical protein B0T17DRAFT_221350 [Bombardia bombarda]|uniref:Uncharacterized protein n=1 Tax=Bombardia bombarda TaxID=252184 RepID=A0AA39XB39_9PEZI|nr:hypothetical protein B0T17DRAFT_221350 [Bombardia bombarda]